MVITADYPSTLTTSLSYGQSTSVSFSKCGHYIASGLIDGIVIVIDTWTHNISSILRGHSKSVIGVKWVYNEDGKVGLISWSNDWTLISWELNDDNKFQLSQQFKFTGGVIDSNWILINGQVHIIVSKVDGTLVVINSANGKLVDVTNPLNLGDGTVQCLVPICNGTHVIAGTSKGWLQVINTDNCQIVKVLKICGSNIKGIQVVEQAHYEKGGDNDSMVVQYGSELCPMSKMLINSSDKILRQYNISTWTVNAGVESWELELEQKYQDVVNQFQWNKIKLGPTGEYICASTKSHGGSSHEIYLWETSMGSLVQILEGSQEELYDIDWCGLKCEIVATGFDTGTVYLWGIQIEPKWSALAPDFEEIEQNIDYDEQEDEFDFLGGVEHDDNISKMEHLEDKFVDVFKKEKKDARGFNIINNVRLDIDLV